jgi:hypothetical protein
MPSQNKLAGTLDSDEGISIADLSFVRFGCPLVAFLLAHESPDFVALHILHRNAVYAFGQEPFAVLTGKYQQVENGSLLYIAEARRRAHAVTLHEMMEDHRHLVRRQAYIRAERLLLRLSEALSALLAFESLDFVFAVKTGLHHLDSAIVARHFEPCFLQANGPK